MENDKMKDGQRMNELQRQEQRDHQRAAEAAEDSSATEPRRDKKDAGTGREV